MSTQKVNEKTVEKKNDQVEEVTKKLDELNVDNKQEANDEKPRRVGRVSGRGGRGRGRGGRGARTNLPRVPYEEQLKKIEEEQKGKKVIETGVKGRVKWFNVRGRYGFVARENGENEKEDFFVHQTAIIKSSTIKVYLRTLEDDEQIVFDIVEGRKGQEAANVTGPDGENVKGSRFSRQLLFRFRNPQFRRGGPPRRRQNTDKSNGEKAEENADGEVRSQRRPHRARGKVTPKTDNHDENNGNEEKGSGDSAAPVSEKKPNRRNNRNKNKKNTNNNNNKGEQVENKQAIEA